MRALQGKELAGWKMLMMPLSVATGTVPGKISPVKDNYA